MQKTSSRKRGARLGQHFLANARYAAMLADAVGVRDGETILEIGPGKGALTRELLARGPVIAIEKDEALVAKLRETFANEITSGQLRLICDDIRNFDPARYTLQANRYLIAANIPYYITGEIVRQFLTIEPQPRAMALLIQKEVAERIVARTGKESILSLSVKAYGTPRIIAKVSRGNFSPPPSVDSAILLIDGIARARFAGEAEERAFFTVVRAGFASKRKYLANNLAVRFEKDAVHDALTRCRVSDNARAEDVPLDTWLALARELH